MKRKHLINLALVAAAGWLITYSPVNLNKGPHAFDDGSYFDYHLEECHSNEVAFSIDKDDFEEFIEKGEIVSGHQDSFELDTTGDGKKENIVTGISWKGDNCVISCSIEKENKVLWKDEYEITANIARQFYPKVQENQIKKLQYYLGLCQLNFMDKLDIHTPLPNEIKTQLATRMIEGPFSDTEKTQVLSFLDEYSGYFLGTLDLFNESLYSWNDNEQAFVLIVNS